MGITNLLILGTAPTMASPVFGSVFEKSGIHGFVPSSHAERKNIVALIAELYADKNDNANSRISAVVDSVYPANGGERAVCLACTELPLAYKNIENETDLKVGDIHYLNTTMIHVKASSEAIVGDDRHNLLTKSTGLKAHMSIQPCAINCACSSLGNMGVQAFCFCRYAATQQPRPRVAAPIGDSSCH
jgi:hypothetical protein